MFKYINEILKNFTQRERILVLILLLFTIVTITVGNQLLKTAKGLPDDYHEYVETVINEKNKLSGELFEAKRKLVDNGIECTNTILNRELEIREEIRRLLEIAKEDERRYRRTEYRFSRPAPTSNNDTIQISAMVLPIEVEVNPLNTVIKGLEKMEKELVKN